MFENLKTRWNALTAQGRAFLIVGVLAIVILLIGGTYWIAKDDYQVLFSDLASQDASAMVGELDRMKVPYRLAENGTTILVDRDAVYKTRLKLMGKGLDLHGTVGFEVFNNADYGMTEFAQKVNYQRAMQGELARTIMGFDEIKQARVHLVLPESGLFKNKNAKPKASISLVMKDDSQLLPEQITGIQRLVAASVPEIEASAVTIVDQRGIAVSRNVSGNDNEEANSGGRLDTKKQIEEYLTRKIVSVLDRALGPGRAIVSVDATLNYDQVKISKEDVVPLPNTSGQHVGAILKQRESVQGGETSLDLSSHSTSKRMPQLSPSTAVETEYVNSRRFENIVSTPGGISRLSVGVLVPTNLDAVQLAKLKEVVMMATGLNTARGDAIAIYNVDAPSTVADQHGGSGSTLPALVGPLKPEHPITTVNALLLLLVLLFLAGVFWWRTNYRRSVSHVRLSESERERMLQQVSEWAMSRNSQGT